VGVLWHFNGNSLKDQSVLFADFALYFAQIINKFAQGLPAMPTMPATPATLSNSGTIPSGRKVCVGGGWSVGSTVTLVLCFGPEPKFCSFYLDLDQAEQ
jgi:hypothetical protein